MDGVEMFSILHFGFEIFMFEYLIVFNDFVTNKSIVFCEIFKDLG